MKGQRFINPLIDKQCRYLKLNNALVIWQIYVIYKWEIYYFITLLLIRVSITANCIVQADNNLLKQYDNTIHSSRIKGMNEI